MLHCFPSFLFHSTRMRWKTRFWERSSVFQNHRRDGGWGGWVSMAGEYSSKKWTFLWWRHHQRVVDCLGGSLLSLWDLVSTESIPLLLTMCSPPWGSPTRPREEEAVNPRPDPLCLLCCHPEPVTAASLRSQTVLSRDICLGGAKGLGLSPSARTFKSF